ncbi:MAG: DUF975 family protein [Bacteroidota bacterium]|nr:DUF975 family protein [Bacteroidota bacterium]
MRSNIDLIKDSVEILSGKWSDVIPTFFFYAIIAQVSGDFLKLYLGFGLFQAGLFDVMYFALTAPMSVGIIIYSLAIVNGKEFSFNQIFKPYDDYLKTLGLVFVLVLMIIGGFILFIIPGIIISLIYSMSLYVLAEEPEISIINALKKSSELTQGFRTKLFLLGLIYSGLAILSIFTLFIGLIWLMPLFGITSANFYNELKRNQSVKKIS